MAGAADLKLCISGATGVLGRRVVSGLLSQGYQVIGLSRSRENDERLDAAGAIPRRADLFSPKSVKACSSDCHIFLHLATAIPNKARTSLRDWAINDRIRRQGTEAMLAAAAAAEAEFFLSQSLIALHGNQQGAWVEGTTPISSNPGGVLQSAVDLEHRVAAAQAEGLATCILRFGMFYAADSAQTQGMLSTIEAGGFPILGAGQNYWNMIHVDDAARAVVSAVKHRNDLGGATLDLADDQPVTMADLINELARMTGGPKPRSVPVWLSRVLIGGHVVDYLLSSVRCRNQAAKEALQLNLKYPTYLAGFNSVISELQNS